MRREIERVSLPQTKQLGAFIEQNFAIRLTETNYRALDFFIPRRLEELGLSFDDYLQFLAADLHKHGSEIKALLDEVTVQETYFFRDWGQFQALKEVVLPDLLEKNKHSRSLRIWSAGCSTGEEPYTIGILLREHFPQILDWNILIRGTDVNMFALKKAREALYTRHSFRGVPDFYRQKYFKPVGNRFALDESVKKMVQFDYFNLASDSFLPVGHGNRWDLIFCRNVLIYFHRDRIVSLLERFHEALRPEGYLFLGFSESLHFFPNRFRTVHHENSFFYAKEGLKDTAPKRRARKTLSRNLPIKTQTQPGQARGAKPKALSFEEQFQKIQELFALEFYRQAWEKLEELPSVPPNRKLDVFFLKARLQVNLLRHEEARETLQSILAEDPLYKDAYFLKALLARNESDLPAAVANFRKVLYVDSDYVLARLYLGDVYHMLKQTELTLREYRNGLRTLQRRPDIDLGPFAAGFSAEILTQILKNKIESLENISQKNKNPLIIR